MVYCENVCCTAEKKCKKGEEWQLFLTFSIFVVVVFIRNQSEGLSSAIVHFCCCVVANLNKSYALTDQNQEY